MVIYQAERNGDRLAPEYERSLARLLGGPYLNMRIYDPARRPLLDAGYMWLERGMEGLTDKGEQYVAVRMSHERPQPLAKLMGVTWLVPFDPTKFSADDPRHFSHVFEHTLDGPFAPGERSKCGIQVENLRPGVVFQRDYPDQPVCERCEALA